jgi:hypothetical protein
MAQRISVEEYNRQSKDYTKEALSGLNKELNATNVGTYKRTRVNISESNDDIPDPINISLIVGKSAPALAKTTNKTVDNAYLISTINKLENQIIILTKKNNKSIETISQMDDEIADIDKKYYYLKLEYSNKCVDYEELNKKYKLVCNDNTRLISVLWFVILILLALTIMVLA